MQESALTYVAVFPIISSPLCFQAFKREWPMTKVSLVLRAPSYYDLFMTCHAHGWINLAPFRWNAEMRTVSFAIVLAGRSVDIEAREHKGTVEASVTSRGRVSSKYQGQLVRAVTRALGLDVDTRELLEVAAKAGSEYAELVTRGAGRLLRGTTLWEDAAKTLFTTNCSWHLTQRMAESVCSARFCQAAPSGAFPFATPASISRLSPNELRQLLPIGYRAPFLHSLVDRFCGDGQMVPQDACPSGDAIREAIRSLRGFGPYAASHVAVLLGHFDLIPIDSEVESYVRSVHRARNPSAFLARKYARWGRFRWWGYKLDRMLRRLNWIG